MANEIKHIGVPPAVRGHLAKPVNSPIVPVEAMMVTIPIKKKGSAINVRLFIFAVFR